MIKYNLINILNICILIWIEMSLDELICILLWISYEDLELLCNSTDFYLTANYCVVVLIIM
jgi:hypothetical protein